MSSLNFDPNLPTDENIERFYQHLEDINPEFTALLREHIELLLPFPEDTPDRNRLRQQFNARVREALDTVASPPTGEE